MAKVGIDVDGVLANFGAAFVDISNKIYPGRVERGWVPRDWGFDGKFTPAEIDKIWERIRATPNFWLSLSAYPDNIGALARWLAGHKNQDVYFVTSRADTAGMSVANQTELWIRSCGISKFDNYLGVMVVPNSEEKATLYQAAGIEWSIDDKPETVQACDLLHPLLAKHRAYLLDRPWNQGARVEHRIGSVGAFLGEIA
jgi:5' nucleotidase, deoxy (Pyrimidine), cytosolic type C protein (NT5C)